MWYNVEHILMWYLNATLAKTGDDSVLTMLMAESNTWEQPNATLVETSTTMRLGSL